MSPHTSRKLAQARGLGRHWESGDRALSLSAPSRPLVGSAPSPRQSHVLASHGQQGRGEPPGQCRRWTADPPVARKIRVRSRGASDLGIGAPSNVVSTSASAHVAGLAAAQGLQELGILIPGIALRCTAACISGRPTQTMENQAAPTSQQTVELVPHHEWLPQKPSVQGRDAHSRPGVGHPAGCAALG